MTMSFNYWYIDNENLEGLSFKDKETALKVAESMNIKESKLRSDMFLMFDSFEDWEERNIWKKADDIFQNLTKEEMETLDNYYKQKYIKASK